MKSRTWFLLSIALFVAAAYFWHVGEEKRLSRSSSSEQNPANVKKTTLTPEKSSSKTLSPKRLIVGENSAENASAQTNSKTLYPNRLSNTTKTIDVLARDNNAILLRNALIDTGSGAPTIPQHLRSSGDPGSYIVQSRGPLTAVFRAELLAAKAEIISYVPNNAYLVRMSAQGVEKLLGNKDVKTVLPYEPYYKLDAGDGEDSAKEDLLAVAIKKEALPLDQLLRVTLFPGQLAAATAALKGKASIIQEDLKSSPFGPELIVSTKDLVGLANLAAVQGIEPYSERVVLNDLTRVRLGVSSNSLATTLNQQGLTGANVMVNVNDTTIDADHPDLTGRIFSPISPAATIDIAGHGTHVAGIIASSGANGPTGIVPGSVSGADFRGKANAADIFSLDIFSGLSDAELQNTAAGTNLYSFNRQSPLISNNSWGYGPRSYNSAAASYDMAVRDAIPGLTGSQPVIYVFAAGNSGNGNNNGLGGAPTPVVSPSTAKNVITVGVVESPRNITNDIARPNRNCVVVTNKEFLGMTDSSNEVAYFSSRGNVGVSLEGTFGRFKPDLVAPGTFIASTRSRQLDEADYYSTTNYIRQGTPNIILDPGATNRSFIYVPDDPCEQGKAIELTIRTVANANSPNPFPPLEIYVDTNAVPSANAANFVATNSVTLVPTDPKFASGTTIFYDIVNTNNFEVSFNLQTVITVTNDYGNYFTVLKELNDALGTNYFYESGSSMAAPAISGMLALMQEFFEQKLPTPMTNSPALMKALLINCARSPNDLLYKLDAKRTLNVAGWGMPNLVRILPDVLATAPTNEWPIQMFDQTTNTALATGESHIRNVAVTDTNSPLRITLVWTDPPGNPQVGIKLVNDLDLVVTSVVTNGTGTNSVTTTNVYFGNHFAGSQYTDPIDVGTNAFANFDSERDVVNNVENVYINGPLEGNYQVSVVARRVNVNAVTAHTNGIVQDYALVISSGNLTTNAPFVVTDATPQPTVNSNAVVVVLTNGLPLFNQRVGANSPLLATNSSGLSDGSANQWNFYVLNNSSNFQNVAFLTFLPPNLSGTTQVSPGSRRNIEADIDMYVSTDPTLTNLNPTAIAAADKSRGRFGQELIVYTNATAPIYYVGIKSEDQRAAEFGFFGVASALPFSQDDGNGNLIVRGLIDHTQGRDEIPDGSPEKPGGVVFIGFATEPITVGRVVVTNQITHELFGDLIGTLTHGDTFAVLQNHSFPVTLPDFPNGQESGTFFGVYDDSELDPTLRRTDGPGSLVDFTGQEGVGAWLLTMEDNALDHTGRVDVLTIALERSLETNQFFGSENGFTISPVQIPPGQSRGLSFVVPENATNMTISIAPKEGPIDTVVRQGRKIPTRSAPGGPYVEVGKLISPPGGTLTVGLTNTPPLKPGVYSLRLYNDNGGAVTVSGSVVFDLNLTAGSAQTFFSGGPKPIFDDAVTNSTIHVDRAGRVVDVEVGVRIDHERVSDLVLHLVSPDGTRILLAENRGNLSTNGYGVSALTTNVFPTTTAGNANADTNVISTPMNSGILNIDYDFYTVPDFMHVYYDGLLIFDSGMVADAGSFSIPFGPGISTNIVIVMNEGGNPQSVTAWTYDATVLSGQIVYATFSENTNLALVPIKFAIPPFATNFPGSNITTFVSSGFESDAPGNYTTTVDNWTVTTNSVDVIGDSLQAHTGTNFLSLGDGEISRTLPTVAGEFYNLKFAYRRNQPASISTARISLEGVFTNEFIGSPNWVTHSTSFAAPAGGTKLEILGLNGSPGGTSAVQSASMWFDTFSLTEGGDPNYFLPEESLKTLIGETAKGDWKLEVWDNRVGAAMGLLEGWQLHLTFASTNATATTLTNNMPVTNTVAGGEIQYFIIDVPLFATRATNILISGGGPLKLLFNQNVLPVGSAGSGDYTLLPSTVDGTNVLTYSSVPDLQPGRRYYLGVKNVSAAQTNVFTLSVTFDNTNNLVEVTPLTNTVAVTTNLPLNSSIHYYQYDLSNNVSSIEFKLFGLSNDADLVVRRGSLPSSTSYDYNSTAAGTNDEVITVSTPVVGRYYLGVYGFAPSNSIDYSIMVTEGGAGVPRPVITSSPTLTSSGFQVTASTVIGEQYQFEVSTDLINWTIVSTTTATSNITMFTDPTPPSTQTARFYRLRVVP